MLLLSELHLSRKHPPSALAPSGAINRNRTLEDESGLGRPKAPRAGCACISLDRLEARLLTHYSFVATTVDGAVMATTVGNSRAPFGSASMSHWSRRPHPPSLRRHYDDGHGARQDLRDRPEQRHVVRLVR